MKRASYREAVEWIAWNDEPDEREVDVVIGYASVVLIADIFRVEHRKVAEDVVRKREKDVG